MTVVLLMVACTSNGETGEGAGGTNDTFPAAPIATATGTVPPRLPPGELPQLLIHDAFEETRAVSDIAELQEVAPFPLLPPRDVEVRLIQVTLPPTRDEAARRRTTTVDFLFTSPDGPVSGALHVRMTGSDLVGDGVASIPITPEITGQVERDRSTNGVRIAWQACDLWFLLVGAPETPDGDAEPVLLEIAADVTEQCMAADAVD